MGRRRGSPWRLVLSPQSRFTQPRPVSPTSRKPSKIRHLREPPAQHRFAVASHEGIEPPDFGTRVRRRLVNGAEREDVGGDQAVAMGFKEVEPVDFLAGRCLVGFPSGAATSPRPQLSRARPLDEWDTEACARN